MEDTPRQTLLRIQAGEDSKLVSAARSGDQAAFAELWRRHYQIAISITRLLAPEDADDIVAEAFASIWDRLQRGSGPNEHFRGYLISTCRNMAARTFRDRERTVSVAEVEGDPVSGASELAVQSETRHTVTQAFALLPERWQTILWLQEIEEVPRAEIAQRLDISPNSVSALTRRAKEGLRIEWLRLHLPRKDRGEHDDVLELLPKYLRGSLTRDRLLGVRHHLKQCLRCAGLEKDLRSQNRVLGQQIATSGAFVVLLFAGVTGTQAAIPAASAQASLLAIGQHSFNTAIGRGRDLFVAAKMASVPALATTVATTVVGAAAITAAVVGISLPNPDPQPPKSGEVAGRSPADSTTETADRPWADPSVQPSPTSSPTTPPQDSIPVPEGGTTGGTQTPGLGGSAAIPPPTGPTTPPPPPVDPPAQNRPLTAQIISTQPPQLAGTASSGAFVRIAVGQQSMLILVDGQQNWFADMSSLAFPPGTYAVTVSQHMGDQHIDSINLTLVISG